MPEVCPEVGSGDGGALPVSEDYPGDLLEERALIEAAQRGDESALTALYRNHYSYIYRYVLFRLRSPSAAEDVTSQVFVEMVRHLGRYRWQGKPFLAWLYAITQKQVSRHRKGSARAGVPVDLEAADELIADTAGPHATAEERERRLRLAKALRMLPESQREVILLRYVLSLSLAETAASIGRSEGAVKQLQLRGLASLKDILSGGAGAGLL